MSTRRTKVELTDSPSINFQVNRSERCFDIVCLPVPAQPEITKMVFMIVVCEIVIEAVVVWWMF